MTLHLHVDLALVSAGLRQGQEHNIEEIL